MPRVSICIPTYNVGSVLTETLDSVWAQDYQDFEVITVDDASSDDTVEVLGRQTDPRLRAFYHQTNQGQARTVDETVRHARGEYVKFLDHDDLLRPDCLRRMVEALDANPGASFVFSRRDIMIDESAMQIAEEWLEHHRELQTPFGPLAAVNDGGKMLCDWIEAEMFSNWVAEPAGVMARRDAMIAVGGRSYRVRMLADMETWARLMTRGDVAFLDEPLYDYRFSLKGLTGAASTNDRHWLDQLWIAESLLSMQLTDHQRAVLLQARRTMTRRIARRTVSGLVKAKPGAIRRMRDFARYMWFRAVRRLSGRASLFDALEN